MVFHIGCTLGSSFSSFASGHVFENADDPMAVWYINVLYTAVQVIDRGITKHVEKTSAIL